MSNESKIDNEEGKVKEFVEKYALDGYFFMKCGCGLFVTDYPFVAECSKCGYIGCGNTETLKKAEEKGELMQFIEPKEISIEEREKLVTEYEKEIEEWNEYEKSEGD